MDPILFMLVAAVACNVYLSWRMLGQVRQLIAQVAVMTMRMMDAGDALQTLEHDLRAELDRED